MKHSVLNQLRLSQGPTLYLIFSVIVIVIMSIFTFYIVLSKANIVESTMTRKTKVVEFEQTLRDGLKGNSFLDLMNTHSSWVFLCIKNDNKNGQLAKLSQSFSDIFHNSFSWVEKMRVEWD